MAYRVVYGEEKKRQARLWGGRRGFRIMTALVLLLFVLGARVWWSEGAEVLKKVLLPGQTELALQTLVENVSGGASLGEAVTAFCREIVADAGLAG